MYIRRHKRKKNGKKHTYWSLVESYRTPKGPRNRIVAYLGEIEESERKGWVNFTRSLDGKPLPEETLPLFQEDPAQEPVPETIEVKVSGVDIDETFDFGDVWLASVLWRSLELDKLLAGLQPKGIEDVQWSHLFAVLAFARFCEPSSELHICEKWYPRSCLPLLIGIPSEAIYPMRLYRTLDKLLPHKEAIEKHLKERLGTLFEIEYDILLYDVTSTYFEGESNRNPQAKRGYSRDKRGDCKQVCIGLVVTKDGLPLGYEVFDGNRNDVTTVEEIVDAMEAKYGRADRIWVMDRGMVKEENLEYIRERKGQYIVGANRSELKAFKLELLQQDWHHVYEDLEVKLCDSPDGQEKFVLCRSAARAEKERAMHERCSRKIEDDLNSLGRRLARARKPIDRDEVNRQIGRILQRNSRAAGKYKIHIRKDPYRKDRLVLHWEIDTKWQLWKSLRDGTYLLRTNITNLDGETLWKMYTQLTDVEESFRSLKSDLGIRPVHHQIEHRVQAHILVAFLGYFLWKTLDMWCQQSGLGRSARTVIEELRRLKCSRVLLPTTSGRTLSLHCVTRPDKFQKPILSRLKLEIPRRLGEPRWRMGTSSRGKM